MAATEVNAKPGKTLGRIKDPFASRLDPEIAVGRLAAERRYFARVAIDLPAKYANVIEWQPRWHSSTIVDIGAVCGCRPWKTSRT
jgi:hypothetical protein